MEEGQEVTIFLTVAYEMPMSPADLIKGIWTLDRVEHNGKDITEEFDPEHQYFMFIRWDRIYIEGDVDGKRNTGYWFMHPHKPEFTIIPHGTDPKSEAWNVTFPGNSLIMTGVSPEKEGVVMTFSKSDGIPE